MADITIALPTLNEENYIVPCLDSILSSVRHASPYFSFETLVVDSYSTDRTVELAEEHPVVDAVHPVEEGLLHARHEAFKQADGDIVVSIDADAIYDTEFLYHLLTPFKMGENVAMTYGSVKGEHPFDMNPVAMIRLAAQYGLPLLGLDWVSGSNRAVDRETYFTIGGYNLDKDGKSLRKVIFEEQFFFPYRLSQHGSVEFTRAAESRQIPRTFKQVLMLQEKDGGKDWTLGRHYTYLNSLQKKVKNSLISH